MAQSQCHHGQVSLKKLGFLFAANRYLFPSHLMVLYETQIHPSLEYCSHVWAAVMPFPPPFLFRMLCKIVLFASSAM